MGNILPEKPWGFELNPFVMLMHLSQLINCIVPGAGIILSLVMWLTKRNEYSEIDNHGKIIMNWTLSAVIYILIAYCLILIFGSFGFFFAMMIYISLPILYIGFAIIGGVRAGKGQCWQYPLSIKFFK